MSFLDRKKGRWPVPVMEEVNLKVIVSEIKLKKRFDFITRIIWFVQWPSATVLFSTFGVDAALTNGIQVKYLDQLILPHGIKTNAEFSETSYDVRIDSDATAPKINNLTARMSFFKFTRKAEGIKIDAWRNLSFLVQDNLSGSSNTHIIATVQGWRI